MIDNERIAAMLRSFAAERDWDQFHSPKNLATSIAGKAGNIGYPAAPSEIAHFMTMMKDTTPQLSEAERTSISAYLADVAVKQKLVPPPATTAAGGGR